MGTKFVAIRRVRDWSRDRWRLKSSRRESSSRGRRREDARVMRLQGSG